MNGALVKSVVFHAVIVILSIVGLPYLAKDYPLIDNSIAVEILEVDKLTQTTKPPVKAPPSEDKPKNQPKDLQPESKKPQAPTVVPAEMPKPVEPERPRADDIAPPQKDKAQLIKKEEPKKAPPKPRKRPDTPPVKPVEEKTQDDQKEFDNLLVNLMKNQQKTEATENEGQGAQASQGTLADRMTMSELDAVRQQLGQCWKLLAGARYAEDLVVQIKLTINPDRTVKAAHIVDQLRYSQDGFFRAAADSAYRAVFSPECSPLKLPPDKYNQWNTMTVTFDPREML